MNAARRHERSSTPTEAAAARGSGSCPLWVRVRAPKPLRTCTSPGKKSTCDVATAEHDANSRSFAGSSSLSGRRAAFGSWPQNICT